MTEIKKKLFEEIRVHLIYEDMPSEHLSRISEEEQFREYPFSMLSRLKEISQSPEHHPEGNVWNHILLVVDEAAARKDQSGDPAAFMWAALLHDVGKADTTKCSKGRITSYNHDEAGALLAEDFLKSFTDDKALIQHVVSLVRWHMQLLFVTRSMRFADIGSLLAETNPEEVALLGYCDRMGRLGADRQTEIENMEIFMTKCHEFIARIH